MVKNWSKPFLTLIVMGALAWYSPSAPMDPWNLLSPKKIATMVFALAFIQVFGTVMNRLLGVRAGAILTGFFGGLVSSTATTASLARKSKIKTALDTPNEMLIFLSATLAMLLEGFILVWSGTTTQHHSVLFVFLGPLILMSALIFVYSQKLSGEKLQAEEVPFHVWPILKLSIFIVSILLLSKLLQNFFGQNGLMVLTFLVSLFEIHGSVIANIQLHENGAIPTALLSSLLALSILASSFSKIALISTLGTKHLSSQAIKCTVLLFLSLIFSLAVSLGVGRS